MMMVNMMTEVPMKLYIFNNSNINTISKFIN